MEWVYCFQCKFIMWDKTRMEWVCRKLRRPDNVKDIYAKRLCNNFNGGKK